MAFMAQDTFRHDVWLSLANPTKFAADVLHVEVWMVWIGVAVCVFLARLPSGYLLHSY